MVIVFVCSILYLAVFAVYWVAIYEPINDLFMRVAGNTEANKKARRKIISFGLFWPFTFWNLARLRDLSRQAKISNKAKELQKNKIGQKRQSRDEEMWNRKI